MARLSGKLCIVTGGAQGIGRAICEVFADEGAEVILTDKNVEGGQDAAGEIGCQFAELDVREEAHWGRIASLHPKIDVLVNNAGITAFEESAGPHDPENS